MVKSVAAAGVLVFSTAALGALVELTYFASDASGSIAGQPFEGQDLVYTVTLDTATGQGPGGNPHQSMYSGVAIMANLQLLSSAYPAEGTGVVLMGRDEGLDILWVTAFDLRAQFTTPAAQGPLQSILFPNAFVEGYFQAIGNSHPFPIFDRITGVFQSTSGPVAIDTSTVDFLRVTFVPAPSATCLLFTSALLATRRRRASSASPAAF